MEIIITQILGQNTKVKPRVLPAGVGVSCVNVKPPEEGDAQPWRVPLAVSPAPSIPSGRVTLYRMGRDASTPAMHWLSWTGRVSVIRGFDKTDPTERTYYTDGAAPRWTDNIQALASAPYPAGSRLLTVPQPTVGPVVTLNTNGTGDDRRTYYAYTWVNDIGWESAPSPPTLAPTHKPGAILNLVPGGGVPSGSYGVTIIRWYRTETPAGDAEFFFLREYAIGASGMQDDARGLGADVLPTDAATMRLPLADSAHSLTACWNEFAAALAGKSVRFCEPNLIYAWPLGNEYTLEDTPVAQAVFAQRLLVLTTAGAHIFTGSDPEAMDRKPVAVAPIVSARSLVASDGWCAWAAGDGLYYYGVDGYRNLTEKAMTGEQWSALAPSTMHCHLFQPGSKPYVMVFYFTAGTWKGLVIDPSSPDGIYALSVGYPAAYWDKLLRRLYVLDGATLREWDAGATRMTASFRSQVFRQPYTDDSGEWLELIAEGTVNVKVFTENTTAPEGPLVQRMNRDLTMKVHSLPEAAIGRDWQIELTWTGSLQGVSIA